MSNYDHGLSLEIERHTQDCWLIRDLTYKDARCTCAVEAPEEETMDAIKLKNLKMAIQALRLVSVDLAQEGYAELSDEARDTANHLFQLRDSLIRRQ